MAVFDVGDWTVYPAVHGAEGRWTASYSITTRAGIEPERRFPVTDVPGTFPTEEEAMRAAVDAGGFIALSFVKQGTMQ